MPKPQAVVRDGRTYYRVQIRRQTRGIKVDEYFRTKRRADEFIREVEAAIAEGRPVAQSVTARETFADAVAIYLDDPASMTTTKGRPLKPSAARDRKNRIRWLARECFGEVHLHRLTWTVVDEALSKKARELHWSSATRYRYETTLSRFLDYARRKGWVASNILAGQQRLNDAEARRRTFTDAEWSRLLDAADDRGGMLPTFLRLAWETGCRKSELLKLRWVDIEEIDHPSLGAALDILDAKNREDRRVFVSKATLGLLRAHEQEYRRPTSDLVFPSRTRGGSWSVDGPFQEARRAAGLDGPDVKFGEVLSLHHIRHTWATRLGERGASLAQLMAAGGWKTAGMAMRYMRRKDAQALEAAAMLTGVDDD